MRRKQTSEHFGINTITTKSVQTFDFVGTTGQNLNVPRLLIKICTKWSHFRDSPVRKWHKNKIM